MTRFPFRPSVCVRPIEATGGQGSDLFGKGQTLNTQGTRGSRPQTLARCHAQTLSPEMEVRTREQATRGWPGGHPEHARPRGGLPCASASSRIYTERVTRDRGSCFLGTGACVRGGPSRDTLGARATESDPPLSAGWASMLAVTGRLRAPVPPACPALALATLRPALLLGAAPSEPDSPRGTGPADVSNSPGPRTLSLRFPSFLGHLGRLPHHPVSLFPRCVLCVDVPVKRSDPK